jgi:hypothetical protein
MSGWESFFVAQVGASAAVAGLVFVGVSINLDKILKNTGLPGRALEALVVLILVLITSSLMLVPGQSNMLIGSELLAIGLIGWIWVVVLDALNRRQLKPQYRVGWVILVALAQLGVLPFIIAGAVVLAQGSVGLYWLVPGVIFCFLVAFSNAWVLLIEINR